MAKKSFDDETLKWVREMPLSLVLDRLRDAGKLFWRRDADFKPEKDARTVRLYVSSPGVASENGKNRTLSLCRGWHPAVQRRNGHAEVLGHVLGRYATGQQLFG